MSDSADQKAASRLDFRYLTTALVLYLFLSALAHQFLETALAGRLIEGFLVLTLGTAIWSIRRQGTAFKANVGLMAGAVIVAITGFVLDHSGFWFVHALILLVFFLVITWLAIKQVLFSGSIDLNAIVGAICVYLLIGLAWSMVYLMLELSAPGSFKGITTTDVSRTSMELIYFSYISLTTVGYGDISPVSPLARFFSFMEGVFGQFYVAVLVASLVGVTVSRWK